MSRLRAAMIALGMLAFAGPHASAARAQSGMCADAIIAEAIESSASEAPPESVAEPAAEEGLMVVALDDLSARLARTPAQDERDLPWCSSPNDARCSKLPAGSTPSTVSAGDIPSLVVHALAPLPRASSTAHSFAARAGDGPRDAALSSLERPPR